MKSGVQRLTRVELSLPSTLDDTNGVALYDITALGQPVLQPRAAAHVTPFFSPDEPHAPIRALIPSSSRTIACAEQELLMAVWMCDYCAHIHACMHSRACARNSHTDTHREHVIFMSNACLGKES